MTGIEVIIHCASGPRGDAAATRNLAGAARQAGIQHLAAAVTGRATGLLRSGLAILALVTAIQGAWMYLAPRSFYNDVPTVSASGPFSEHLMSDIGGLNLAMAVVLGCAAVRLDRRLARVALAAYLVYAVSHLLFHATHPMGLPAGDAAFLITSLSLLPAIALALLTLTTRYPARSQPPRHQPGAPNSNPALDGGQDL